MSKNRIIVVGHIERESWFEQIRRVHSTKGICPTLDTKPSDIKILVESD